MVKVRLQCCAQPCDRAHQKADVGLCGLQNVRYVRAYTRKLTDPVLDADMSVSCHLCVSAASLCVPMSGASLCVPMCGASLCVPMCGASLCVPMCSLPVCAHVWSLPVCVNVRRTFTCLPVLFRLFPFELFSVGGGWL